MSSDQLAGLLPLVLLVLVFWFLILRPARKRQRAAADTQHNLEIGARIMLTSGIFGTVEALDDETMEVQIAAGTTVTAHRQAVAKVIPAEQPADEPDTDGIE
ncbi:MAG: preprotein translocase subunit YajC [Nocardioidaceae bacterium]